MPFALKNSYIIRLCICKFVYMNIWIFDSCCGSEVNKFGIMNKYYGLHGVCFYESNRYSSFRAKVFVFKKWRIKKNYMLGSKWISHKVLRILLLFVTKVSFIAKYRLFYRSTAFTGKWTLTITRILVIRI